MNSLVNGSYSITGRSSGQVRKAIGATKRSAPGNSLQMGAKRPLFTLQRLQPYKTCYLLRDIYAFKNGFVANGNLSF